jgi:hypothetical protein
VGPYPSAKHPHASLFCTCNHLQQVERSPVQHVCDQQKIFAALDPRGLCCVRHNLIRTLRRRQQPHNINVIWPCKILTTAAAEYCTATTMAEATEGNPIVFFDVTLGGMPTRIFL